MSDPQITNQINVNGGTSVFRMVNKVIWITFSLPGMHRYPDAPDEVAYLRFASVYSAFNSLEDFEQAISDLRNDRE